MLRRGEMADIETEVLVVGKGPAGVMLAYELALAGAGITVIDKGTELPSYSIEVGIPVRTVEILEQRGLLADVAERAHTRLPDAHFAQWQVRLRYEGGKPRRPYAVCVA